MIEKQIIQYCKAGKEQGYARLYKNTAPYVYSLLKRYIQDVDYRKDIMQEIYAKVFLNIKNFDEEKGTFKHWLRKIAINECLQHLRKARPLFLVEGLENNVQIQDEAPLPTDLKRSDIEQILQKMPAGYKLVFMLSVMDGFSHQEISDQLKITKETSRSQLTRAKKWAKRYLNNHHKQDLYGLL